MSAELNPFNADVVAALDSPRYTSGEHRIAFSDQSNGVEGHVYGKSLEMAIKRAEYVVVAINQHATLTRQAEAGRALAEALQAALSERINTSGLSDDSYPVLSSKTIELARQALAQFRAASQP